MKNLTAKQKHILEVAIDLFYEKGFADTSMRDIAEVLNVKAASLYAHISSKEEILEWISEDVKNRFLEHFDEINNCKNSLETRFRLMVENHLRCMFHNVKLYDVFFTNIFRLRVDFKGQNKYLLNIENYTYDIEAIIKDYYKSIGLKDDENIYMPVRFTVNVLNNLYRYVSQDNFDVKKHANFIQDIVLYGVIGKK